MYTSVYTTSGNKVHPTRAKHTPVPTKEELLATNTTLQVNQRVLGGKGVIRKVLSETSFVLYHEEFRQEFMARKIEPDENISDWVNLQTHSNIVTAFDTFFEESTQSRYAMVELTNKGNMYQFIADMNLNLAIDVKREYRELVFDVAI